MVVWALLACFSIPIVALFFHFVAFTMILRLMDKTHNVVGYSCSICGFYGNVLDFHWGCDEEGRGVWKNCSE